MYTKKTIVQVIDSEGNTIDVDSLIKNISNLDREISSMQLMRKNIADKLNDIVASVPEAVSAEMAISLQEEPGKQP